MVSLPELNMQYLRVDDQDMRCLQQLPNLQHISFLAMTVTNNHIRLLSSFPALTSLSIKYCSDVTDYSPISLCSQLRALTIQDPRHNTTPAEVQAIAQLQHLQKLRLATSYVDITCLQHVFSIRELRELTLANCDGHNGIAFKDVSGLPSLCKLEKLCLSCVNSMDVSKVMDLLAQMPRLSHIYLAGYHLIGNRKSRARLRDALPRLESMHAVELDD